MSMYLLPKMIIKKIDSVRKRFLGKEEEPKGNII
jgi:hypothetical protein